MDELKLSFEKLLSALGIKNEITEEQISNLPYDEERLSMFLAFLNEKNIQIIEGEVASLDYFKQLKKEMDLYDYKDSFALYSSNANSLSSDTIIEISKYHFPLIFSVIKKYYPNGFDFFPCYEKWDAFQDGYLGLLKAIEHFKPELGYSFSTYATYWIYAEINKSYSSFVHSLSYSDKMKVKLNWYYCKKEEYLNKYDSINLEEFAKYLGISFEEINFYETHIIYAASLEEVYNGQEQDIPGSQLKTFIPLDYDLEEDVLTKVMINDLKNHFKILNNFEKEIIFSRYGYEDGMFHTYREVSTKFFNGRNNRKIGPEWIRVTEKKALNKLRKRIGG